MSSIHAAPANNGIAFDSKYKTTRWAQQRFLEQTRETTELGHQVVVPLEGHDGHLLVRQGRQRRITLGCGYVEVATGLTVYEGAKFDAT